MLDREFARNFAHDWIDSWNSHDLDRVLSHYTEDFEMSSPLIARVNGEATGTLKGKGNVAGYWRKSLNKFTDLKFELIDVLVSVDTICIYYNTVLGLRAVEWLQFNSDHLVYKASGHYNDLPSA